MKQQMSMSTKRELLLRIRREYLSASKSKKTKLLDTLVEATGYDRKYATSILNKPANTKASQKRTRKSKYGRDVIDVVRQLWRAANGICAKRLLPFLPTLIDTLERFGHMSIDKQLRKKILEMSVSTLERMLKKEREKEPKGQSLTRPGSLLRKQIAVKTFAEWNDQKIGFFEIDLVAHCGGDISGRFINTLTLTDVATGWTEMVALLNKIDPHVRTGIEKVIKVLPFKLEGIDCDNGKEFLNYEMVAWCKAREITFTRSRAYRKNDQAHVEEKNGSVVRRLVGYERFEGQQAFDAMTELYAVARLYINYFQPSMKLIKKTRTGAKVSKEYDRARTPLERFLSFKTVSREQRSSLLNEFRSLDPVALLSRMAELQTKLWLLKKTGKNNMVSKATSAACRPAHVEVTEEKLRTPLEPTTAVHRNPRMDPKEGENKATKKKENVAIPERALRKSKTQARGSATEARKSRVEFTQEFVNNAVHPAGWVQFIYRDTKLRGFGLRLTSGSKSYIVESRFNGNSRRITIGSAQLFTLVEARVEAIRLLRMMRTGAEPLSLHRRNRNDAAPRK